MRRPLLVAAVTALIVACGGDAVDVEVRPFAEIQDGDVSFENDPDFPGRAIFSVTTTEPAICAIVWGETEDLGNFNNSLAMSGTGIVQHDVFLPGAEPGGTYFYRLQGTTADGILYASEITTFTLPDSDATVEAPELGENLALGATVTAVSSEFGDAWVAENAFDGDLTTEWSTSGDGDDASISIDLGGEIAIGSVEFVTRSMTDGTATTAEFTVVVDGDELGPFPASSPADRRPAEIDVTGRMLTFEVASSSGGNTGALEIAVYGP